MTGIKPVLHKISPFDISEDKIITYSYTGDQQFSVEIIVSLSSNNQIVYQKKTNTFKLEATIPKNTLSNGNSYTVEIIVYNRFDIPSEKSDKVYFITFSKPIFEFANISNSQVIGSSWYSLLINYSQSENELLNDFNINLYDLGHNLIDSSGPLYPTSGMEYTLRSLLDNKGYYVSLSGTTVNGMQLLGEEVFFSVEYLQPSLYAKVILENVAQYSSIKIQSNLILIDGNADHDPVNYIDGEKVDLTEDGKNVVFDSGFTIRGDFICIIDCQNIAINKDFFLMFDENDRYKLSLQKNYGNFYDDNKIKEYFTLVYQTGNLSYRIVSNLFDPFNEDDELRIIIKRKLSHYSIDVEKKGG